MLKGPKEPNIYELQMPLSEFLKSFNQNMPANYPHVTEEQLLRFKEKHASVFKHGNLWSLDQHRKKIIDWLPRNLVPQSVE